MLFSQIIYLIFGLWKIWVPTHQNIKQNMQQMQQIKCKMFTRFTKKKNGNRFLVFRSKGNSFSAPQLHNTSGEWLWIDAHSRIYQIVSLILFETAYFRKPVDPYCINLYMWTKFTLMFVGVWKVFMHLKKKYYVMWSYTRKSEIKIP